MWRILTALSLSLSYFKHRVRHRKTALQIKKIISQQGEKINYFFNMFIHKNKRPTKHRSFIFKRGKPVQYCVYTQWNFCIYAFSISRLTKNAIAKVHFWKFAQYIKKILSIILFWQNSICNDKYCWQIVTYFFTPPVYNTVTKVITQRLALTSCISSYTFSLQKARRFRRVFCPICDICPIL